MPRTNLTALFVESVKAPEHGQAAHWDKKLPGFALRLSQGGRKTWVIAYRFEGRLRWLTLGTYPPLTLADARELAKARLADVQKGADPAVAKQDAREQATFAELRQRYFEDYARARKKSWREDERLLARYVPESWQNRKLANFTRDEIGRLHAAVGRDHGQSAANHLMRLLRAMFNLARDWRLLRADNPASGVKMFREKARERFLAPDELQRLNTALAQEPNPYWRAFFALALLTGLRRSELLAARWKQVDLDVKLLRLLETKAGRPHVLPLSEAAAALIESLPSRSQGEWLFPSTSGKHGHLTEPKTAWRRILRRANVADCRVHDLRHSLASILVQQGYGLALVGRILNHSQIATTQRYSHLAIDNLREALEDAATRVLGNPAAAIQADK